MRRTVFPKGGKMVESARADSREGKLRSQLNISPEGHCHMRCESSPIPTQSKCGSASTPYRDAWTAVAIHCKL